MSGEVTHSLSDQELCGIARALLEQIPRAVAVISVPDCRCICCNHSASEALRRLGMYDGEVLGKHPWDVLPEWERVFAPAFEECRTTGRVITDRSLSFDHVGRSVVWLISLIPNSDESGHITSITATIQDFTEYARAEASLAESNRRLAILSDTAGRLLVTDDPQGLVQSLCEKVMRALDCHAFFNYLVDEERGCLHLNAFAGIPDEIGRSIEWLDYGAAVCGCVARDGTRVVAEDICHNPDPRTDLVKGYGIQAYACHPLLSAGGLVIGTLSFGSRTRTRFSDADLGLMKTVADQVATAMDRIRILREVREHAEALDNERRRLEAVMDALPVGVVITDAQGGIVSTNGMDEKIWGPRPQTQGVEDYVEYRAWWADTGKPVAPKEWASAQAVLKGESVVGQLLEIERFDGTRGFIINSASPIRDADGKIVGSAVAIQDVTRLTEAERREREIEERKLEFYRRTLELATGGKMVLTNRNEIERIAGPVVAHWEITSPKDLRNIRHTVSDKAHEAGMSPLRAGRFATVVGEVTTNAIKHAGEGIASLYRTDEGFLFVASDRGVGIREVKLPDVALKPGYSTAGTLGMGYKVMLSFADRVYLATGPEGTVVGLEMKLHSVERDE